MRPYVNTIEIPGPAGWRVVAEAAGIAESKDSMVG